MFGLSTPVYWYIASYDKVTGEEANTVPISDALAEMVLSTIKGNKYQDVYHINEEGLKVLAEHWFTPEPDLDYQLEVCCD